MRARRSSPAYTVGVDFGTLSARALVVRVNDGAEMGSAVWEYPHGVVDQALPSTGGLLPPDWALQIPEDWLEALRMAVPAALRDAKVAPRDVIGIGTDFTACTVMPTLRDGTPLCELADLQDRPHAYPKLWKHHAAQPWADLITDIAHERGESWIGRYGGRISSEWEFAKALQVLDEDPGVYGRTERWIEAADWIIWQLCGVETRNVCTAGYKGIYQDGLRPSRDYLAALSPGFADFVDEKLAHPLSPLGGRAGSLTARAAEWTGLPEGIAVAVGNVDAHVTAAAAQAVKPGQMLAVMGTSTCHVMNSDVLAEVPGMCGVVRDGIVPGFWGYEAGQSAVGDIFAWFLDTSVPSSYARGRRGEGDEPARIHDGSGRGSSRRGARAGRPGLAQRQPLGPRRPPSERGDRRPDSGHPARGRVPRFAGVDCFRDTDHHRGFRGAGRSRPGLVVAGGLVKNTVLMQIYADVTRRPLSVVRSDQGPALGSAIHAAVAAGAYPDIFAASAAMGRAEKAAYVPDASNADAYDALYEQYIRMHDYFGRDSEVLHRLRRIRDAAVLR